MAGAFLVEPLIAKGYHWSIVLPAAFATALAVAYVIAVPFAWATRLLLAPLGKLAGRNPQTQVNIQSAPRAKSRAA